MWYEDFMYCKSCYDLKQKGNFCPLCLQCYEDSDFTTKVCVGCGVGVGEKGEQEKWKGGWE